MPVGRHRWLLGAMVSCWLTLASHASYAQSTADAPAPESAPPVVGTDVAPASEPPTVEALPVEAPVAEAPAPRVILVAAQAIGVDPVVSRFVNDALASTATELGYQVVVGEETARFAQQVTLPYPPAPADLWRLTYAAGAQRGVFARVWAEAGSYVTEVLVASVDGTGPFVQRAPSGAADLQAVVRTLLQQTLPPPSAQPLSPPTPTAPSVPTPAEGAHPTAPSLVVPSSVSPANQAAPLGRRWDLAVQTEAAFGAGGEFFYNHLLGARIDYRLTREIYAGAYFGYANLRGRNQRISNALMYLQLEDRILITPRSKLTIPLRLGLGYLPRNGPVLRLASGVQYALTPRVSLGADLLVPTFWVIRDRVLFSMDFAAELMITL